MQDYQREFIDFLVRTGALRFGEFRLKSGRISPYFFNAGQFNRGEDIERLGYYYACAIRELDPPPTTVFGPAYKGIPLCIAAVIALKQNFGLNAHYSFDRKEIKDHGEGGWIVGKTPGDGDRIVMVDDVVTDGATKKDAIARLRAASNARITDLVIALDRKEKNARGDSSIADIEASTGVKIRSIVTIHHILDHLPGRAIDGAVVLTPDIRRQIETYLSEHGLDR